MARKAACNSGGKASKGEGEGVELAAPSSARFSSASAASQRFSSSVQPGELTQHERRAVQQQPAGRDRDVHGTRVPEPLPPFHNFPKWRGVLDMNSLRHIRWQRAECEQCSTDGTRRSVLGRDIPKGAEPRWLGFWTGRQLEWILAIGDFACNSAFI